MLLGVTLLDESFTVATAVGFVLILAGSVLATRRSSTGEVAGTALRAGRLRGRRALSRRPPDLSAGLAAELPLGDVVVRRADAVPAEVVLAVRRPCRGPAWPPAPRASCAARRSRPWPASCRSTSSPVPSSAPILANPPLDAASAVRSARWATTPSARPRGVAARQVDDVMHRASPALRMLPSSTITVGTSAAFSVPRSRRTSSPSPPYAVETPKPAPTSPARTRSASRRDGPSDVVGPAVAGSPAG